MSESAKERGKGVNGINMIASIILGNGIMIGGIAGSIGERGNKLNFLLVE